MELQLNSTEVTTSAQSSREVLAVLSGVDEKDVLDHFKLQDVIDHFGENEILDAIGQGKCESYFDLQEKEA